MAMDWYKILQEIVTIVLKSPKIGAEQIRNVRAFKNFLEIFDTPQTRSLIANQTKRHKTAIAALAQSRDIDAFSTYVQKCNTDPTLPYMKYQEQVTTAISQLEESDAETCWRKLQTIQQLICTHNPQ